MKTDWFHRNSTTYLTHTHTEEQVMAALDLHCAVDPAVCVWSSECIDSFDSFDSEIQQWEQQLQELQRKIEELYKVVEARRGANVVNLNTNTQLDITLLPVNNTDVFPNNGCHGGNVNNIPVQYNAFNHQSKDPSDTCSNGCNYQSSRFASPQSCSVHGQDVMSDILDGYLGVSNPQKTRGAPNTSTIGNQSVYKDGRNQWPANTRTGHVSLGAYEEVLNRKNRSAVWNEPQARYVSWKDQTASPEKSVTKPRSIQKDIPQVPTRSTQVSDSPRCPLVDRRCGSPSVLRKFCAMLEENEGKMLIEDGMVTMLLPKFVPTSPKLSGNQGSKHVPIRDPEVSVTFQNWEHRGAKFGAKTSSWRTDNLQTDFKMGERILGNCLTPSPRNTLSQHQVSHDSLLTTPRRSFSRPARPSNQRPPSRWASRAPTATITTPIIPRSRSLSPACKTKQRFNNYTLYMETIIM